MEVAGGLIAYATFVVNWVFDWWVFLGLGVYDVWLGVDWLRLLVLLLCYFVHLGLCLYI